MWSTNSTEDGRDACGFLFIFSRIFFRYAYTGEHVHIVKDSIINGWCWTKRNENKMRDKQLEGIIPNAKTRADCTTLMQGCVNLLCQRFNTHRANAFDKVEKWRLSVNSEDKI